LKQQLGSAVAGGVWTMSLPPVRRSRTAASAPPREVGILAPENPPRDLDNFIPMGRIRTLLVDDNPDFLASAAAYLATEPALEVVGHALSGQEALDQTVQLRPDLVLMDWTMPGMTGLEATQRLKEQPEAPRIVLLTLNDTPEHRGAAVAARADGFLSKLAFGTSLLPLIRALFARPSDRRPEEA
jgi:CheY-like chemotaxis protein